MLKHLLIFSTILLVAAPLALASDREDDAARTQRAAQVFKEIMDTPDQRYHMTFWNQQSVLPSSQEIRSSPSFLEVTTVAEWQPVARPTDGVLRCS